MVHLAFSPFSLLTLKIDDLQLGRENARYMLCAIQTFLKPAQLCWFSLCSNIAIAAACIIRAWGKYPRTGVTCLWFSKLGRSFCVNKILIDFCPILFCTRQVMKLKRPECSSAYLWRLIDKTNSNTFLHKANETQNNYSILFQIIKMILAPFANFETRLLCATTTWGSDNVRLAYRPNFS